MKIKDNFISIVVLGNFNPAILTPDFIKKICSAELGDALKWSSPPGPVKIISQITYKDVELMVDFDRFQVTQKNMEQMNNIVATKILREYLTKLPHTPISAAGLNFNCSLIIGEENNIQFEALYDAKEEDILSMLDSQREFFLQKSVHHKDGITLPEDINVTFPLGDNKKIAIAVQFEPKNVYINFNYEVAGLADQPERFLVLVDDYVNILSQFRLVRGRLIERIVAK
jgi:hypothetical protein